MVNSFAKGAKGARHEVELLLLLNHEVKGCPGFNACRYGKLCIQKDSFNEMVPKIKEADCIVFASPLYFWTLSSKIKAFIERFYCIAEENPTYAELKEWYKKSGLPLKRFFNTSGLLYKSMQLKDKLPEMSEEEQLKLLATDGMLVKRPLVVDGDNVLTGFKEAEWAEKMLS